MSDDVETRIPESKCACGAKLNAASMLAQHVAPKAGDLTLCIRCGALMKFTEGLRVEPYTGYRTLPKATRRYIDRLRANLIRLMSQS